MQRRRGATPKALSRGAVMDEVATMLSKETPRSARAEDSASTSSRHVRDVSSAKSSPGIGRRFDETDTSQRKAAEPFKLTIPLAHQDNPSLNFDDKFNNMIRHEYAVRYLEHLGVNPSKANVAAVRSQIPVEESDVTAFYRSRGWLADYLQIKPSNLTKERKVKLRANEKIHSHISSITNDRIDHRTFSPSSGNTDKHNDHQSLEAKASSSKTDAKGATEPIISREVPKYQDMKKRFVYHQRPDNFSPKSMGRESSSAPTGQSSRRPSQLVSTSNQPQVGKPDIMVVEEAENELISAYFDTGDTLITAIQKAFIERFSFDSVHHRLTEKNIAHFKIELLSAAYGKLISLTCEYMYWKFLGYRILDYQEKYGRSLPIEKDNLEKYQKQYFLAIHQLLNKIELKIQKRTGHMMLYLPIILLMLRVSIEAVFRKNFPRWTKLKEGESVLRDMDDAIICILDPDQYIFHMSTIKSTNEARHSGINPLKLRDKKLQGKYYATSPVVKCLFSASESTSGVHQRYLRSGGNETAEHLPSFAGNEDLRKQLYLVALQRLHPDQFASLPDLGRPPSLENVMHATNSNTNLMGLTTSRSMNLADGGLLNPDSGTLQPPGTRSRPRTPDQRGHRGSQVSWGKDPLSVPGSFSGSVQPPATGLTPGPMSVPVPLGRIQDQRSAARIADLQAHLSKLEASTISVTGLSDAPHSHDSAAPDSNGQEDDEETKKRIEREQRETRELVDMVGSIVVRLPSKAFPTSGSTSKFDENTRPRSRQSQSSSDLRPKIEIRAPDAE